MKYTPTIGLEVHAELKTRTKMFCDSKNDPDETRPNVNICPVCLAHPGTLPVVNHEAVKHVLKMGAALNGRLADYTEFDRKNYFYPDLPKGYQISQYQYPLISGGTLNNVAITRIHLEEDTARSQHGGEGTSLVDFNRSGIPLMELVTEPVIHDAKTASAFAQELQLLLRYLGAGEANMEKGQMRVEANISISSSDKLGTKVEVKNLNSFKAVERAIAYELERQEAVLESGGKVVQETRGWDENKGITFSQRLKEESHDYRYFPDPDIPKFTISRIPEFSKEALVKELPELPWERRKKLETYGFKSEDVEVLVSDEVYRGIYARNIESIADEKQKSAALNILLNEVRGRNPDAGALSKLETALPDISRLYIAGDISSAGVKALVAEILANGGDARLIAEKNGLMQVHDAGAAEALADRVISENEKVATDVRAGKVEAMKFLIGQGMKHSKGSINPAVFEKALRGKLGVG